LGVAGVGLVQHHRQHRAAAVLAQVHHVPGDVLDLEIAADMALEATRTDRELLASFFHAAALAID
jgi:hypothetical protein